VNTAPFAQDLDARRLVTILAPAFNEAENAVPLVGFFREIRDAFPDLDFELVLVDDGSTDARRNWWWTPWTRAMSPGSRAVQELRVARGHHGRPAAVPWRLRHHRQHGPAGTAGGDRPVPAEWRAGADVVWGIRKTRAVPKGAGNLMSRVFSRVFHKLSDIPTYPKEGPSQVLVSRAVIDVVNQMPERNRMCWA